MEFLSPDMEFPSPDMEFPSPEMEGEVTRFRARSHDGTIGSEEVSKLIQALDEKNFWNEVGVG